MEYLNLTIPQKNIYNLQRYYENFPISNICGAVLFQKEKDVHILERAINVVLNNQTALRLRFVTINGEIKQYVKAYSYENISEKIFADEKELKKYANELAVKSLEILESSMYHIEIIHVGERTGILAVLSHLISDAWTFSLLVSQADAIHQALLEGREVEAECVDYTKYVLSEQEYFQSARYEADKIFWEECYSSAPGKATIKPEKPMIDLITASRVTKRMSIALAKDIQLYCEEKNITQAVFFETALYCYLCKINPDSQSITLGIPVLNRIKAWEKKKRECLYPPFP